MIVEVDESHIDDIIDVGDKVECVDNRKIWCDGQNFSTNLVIGNTYIVTSKMKYAGGGRNAPNVLKVKNIDNKDENSWHLKSNFKKA